MYALQGFYNSTRSPVGGAIHTNAEAWWNLLVIGLCIAAALAATQFLADRQMRRA